MTTLHRRLVLERPVLTIDPRRQTGHVCIGGTRIPAEAVAGCVAAGDSVDGTADAYEITRDEVLVACLWFGWVCSGSRRKWERKVAAAWDEWTDRALRVLGGHQPGPLEDPPAVEGATP